MFGRIINRERPVVVLFATHKVARERQGVRESDFKLDLFATQNRRCRQGRDLVKRPCELLLRLQEARIAPSSAVPLCPKTDGLLDQTGFGVVPRQSSG